MITGLVMAVFCSIVLAEAAWGIKRETVTLSDFHGTQVLATFEEINKTIKDRVTPSQPYIVSLDALRDDLAQAQTGIQAKAWVSICLLFLKMFLTVLVALCYTRHVKEQANQRLKISGNSTSAGEA